MKRVYTFILGCLTIAAPLLAQHDGRAKVLADVRFTAEDSYIAYDSALVHDDSFSYLATPGGLYRLPLRITSGAAAELIAFPQRRVHSLNVRDGALYLLKTGHEIQADAAVDHSLLRSVDHGATFQPVDAGLESCYGGYCRFMTPTELHFRDGAMITNAGGNVLASRDEGESWTPLAGALTPQACYDPTLAVVGDRLIIGGECPLDSAYLRAGVLQADSLGWNETPSAVITPYLENRNVQFVRRTGATSTLIAGIEGGILRSSDEGRSFDFALHHPIRSSSYVYFTTLLAPAAGDRPLVIGGFDKGIGTASLMTSRDDGRSWQDQTHRIRFDDYSFDAVIFLHEDVDGRVLAGLLHWDERLIRIVELDLQPARSRPVRR